MTHGEWGPWFRDLAERTRRELGGQPYFDQRLQRLLTLIDLVPAFLDLDGMDWIRDGVRRMFMYRSYDDLDAVRRTLGKQPTSKNLEIFRVFEHARQQGCSVPKSLDYAQSAFPTMSVAAIKQAIRRARGSAVLRHVQDDDRGSEPPQDPA